MGQDQGSGYGVHLWGPYPDPKIWGSLARACARPRARVRARAAARARGKAVFLIPTPPNSAQLWPYLGFIPLHWDGALKGGYLKGREGSGVVGSLGWFLTLFR